MERTESRPQLPPQLRLAALLGPVRPGRATTAGSTDVFTGHGLRRAGHRLRTSPTAGPQGPILHSPGTRSHPAPQHRGAVVPALVRGPGPVLRAGDSDRD